MGHAARSNQTVRTFETAQTRRLRKKMQQVTTRFQFERILAASSDPVRARALLEPLLPEGLPCCATHALGAQHALQCPAKALEQ